MSDPSLDLHRPNVLGPLMLALFGVVSLALLVQGLRSGRMAVILAPTLTVERSRTPGKFWTCAAINGMSVIGVGALALIVWIG